MSQIVVVVVLGLIAFVWVRRNQDARRRWLSRVSLPGSWTCDGEQARSVIEFTGGPAGGHYVERVGPSQEGGEWMLHGAHLTLVPERGTPVEYAFRLFEDGSIGIDGPGRTGRIYVRSATNVVPLRSRR
jgi:hypothetical protein